MKISRHLLVLLISLSILACGPDWMSDYNEAVKFQQTGQIDLAEQHFKLALQKKPELAEAHLNLGLIQINRGWLEGGEVSTLKAIEIFERTRKTMIKGYVWEQALSLAYNNIGIIEMRRALDAELKSDKEQSIAHWKRGISHFQKAVELDSMDSAAQSNIERFKNAYQE